MKTDLEFKKVDPEMINNDIKGFSYSTRIFSADKEFLSNDKDYIITSICYGKALHLSIIQECEERQMECGEIKKIPKKHEGWVSPFYTSLIEAVGSAIKFIGKL